MQNIFHSNFKAAPYWWEAYRPESGPFVEIPSDTTVAIVGGGYAGLACALDLAKAGIDCCVLEAHELGFGASTKSGGAVSGGISIGKSFAGRRFNGSAKQIQSILLSASDAFDVIERLIQDERIDCNWEKTGRFVGAWTPAYYEQLARQIDVLNDITGSGAYMVPRNRQREEMNSDFYYGGMVVQRSAKLHPGSYYKGLLDAVRRQHQAVICSQARVLKVIKSGAHWNVETSRGKIAARDVVIATNGYTSDLTKDLKRRLVPIASHIIATEELPCELISSLIPKGRTITDSKRVLCYYRQSPDGKRVIFGGRARFTSISPEASAVILRRWMIARFPQLHDAKITHAWNGNVAFTFDALPHTGIMNGMHYALGCNGSGVAIMTYLGRETARRIVGNESGPCGFQLEEFPDFPLYSGNPDWALPAIGAYYRFRDDMERAVSGLRSRFSRSNDQ